MKSQFMLPESSRSNRRFGRIPRPLLVPRGTLEMSVGPAAAAWPAMQASTRQSAARIETERFLIMLPPDSRSRLLAAHQCLNVGDRVARAGDAHRHAEMLRRRRREVVGVAHIDSAAACGRIALSLSAVVAGVVAQPVDHVGDV